MGPQIFPSFSSFESESKVKHMIFLNLYIVLQKGC